MVAVRPDGDRHAGVPTSTRSEPVSIVIGVDDLTDAEHMALLSAAVWYFERHARIIAEEADDGSSLAVSYRETFLELHSALWKLGIKLALPDELAPHRRAS